MHDCNRKEGDFSGFLQETGNVMSSQRYFDDPRNFP